MNPGFLLNWNVISMKVGIKRMDRIYKVGPSFCCVGTSCINVLSHAHSIKLCKYLHKIVSIIGSKLHINQDRVKLNTE